jgi:import inner membrane translocase subunit TIM22|tara:strand:+ start:67 stop:606 length:540 start_codon:yes stop_codon:yes gene_type:complete
MNGIPGMPGRGQDPSMPRLNYAVTPQIAPDMMQFTESCMMKPLMTIPLGFVLGAGFGVFMGSWEGIAPPPLLPGIPMAPSKPIAQEFKATARTMGRKARNWSKNFAVVTAVFSGSECALERIRAKNDMWNSVFAGFFSGAALAVKQGPQAMAFGGVGFAVFSVVIDKFTGRHAGLEDED